MSEALFPDEMEWSPLTDVEGYTIVMRLERRPRIHLLRAYEQCNTDDAPNKKRVSGSREVLDAELRRLGYRRGGVACLRCFPRNEDREEPELGQAPSES